MVVSAPSFQRLLPAMPERFILIPGRTSRPISGMSEGNFGQDYRDELETLVMAAADMKGMGIEAGRRVRLASECGHIEVCVAAAKGDELPTGLLFIAAGDLSGRLIGADTQGTGMPTSMGIDVDLEFVPST